MMNEAGPRLSDVTGFPVPGVSPPLPTSSRLATPTCKHPLDFVYKILYTKSIRAFTPSPTCDFLLAGCFPAGADSRFPKFPAQREGRHEDENRHIDGGRGLSRPQCSHQIRRQERAEWDVQPQAQNGFRRHRDPGWLEGPLRVRNRHGGDVQKAHHAPGRGPGPLVGPAGRDHAGHLPDKPLQPGRRSLRACCCPTSRNCP